MTPDINRCDHDLQPLESDTFDVGPSSQWCPKCGLILTAKIAVDALIAEGGETIYWCENHGREAPDGECEVWLAGAINPCKPVQRLLLPIPVEEETTT